MRGADLISRFNELKMQNLILGLDPGRDKIGFAFVKSNGELFFSGMFFLEQREEFFSSLLKNKGENLSQWIIEKNSDFSTEYLKCIISDVEFIAIGNGTHSKEFYDYVRARIDMIKILIVDEKNTTLEARKLYWKIHKPKFFERFVPESLRVPKRVLDDLAAWAIALRALKK